MEAILIPVAQSLDPGLEIKSIPTWPSWTSVFWTQSVRDHYAPIIRQVAAGDPTGVEAEMTTNCSWVAGD